MTVAELIEKLRDMPVDAVVQLYMGADVLLDIKSIELSADHVVIIEGLPDPHVGRW